MWTNTSKKLKKEITIGNASRITMWTNNAKNARVINICLPAEDAIWSHSAAVCKLLPLVSSVKLAWSELVDLAKNLRKMWSQNQSILNRLQWKLNKKWQHRQAPKILSMRCSVQIAWNTKVQCACSARIGTSHEMETASKLPIHANNMINRLANASPVTRGIIKMVRNAHLWILYARKVMLKGTV